MEFGVHSSKVSGSTVVVEGRCLRGAVELGRTFVHMRRFLSPGAPEVAMALEVVSIQAYGNEFDRIEEGMTAALTLAGDVPTVIGEGWALIG